MQHFTTVSNASTPALYSREVHIWKIDFASQLEQVSTLERLLSAPEAARAKAFRFAKDRMHFIIARAMLRTILANYLALNPYEISFHYNAYGKPQLSAEHRSSLHFNLSHSRDIALYAVSMRHAVGIDVEYVDDSLEFDQLAQSVFAASEVSYLAALPQQDKSKAFFQGWTCKEAYIKAVGSGLAIPLDSFVVSLNIHRPAKLIRVQEQSSEAAYWQLHRFQAAAGYIAALAIRCNNCRLSYWQYPSKQITTSKL